MARTYRRQGCRYDYVFALWVIDPVLRLGNTRLAKRLRARFHSDAGWSHRMPPPRAWRTFQNHALRQHNRAVLKHALRLEEVEPLFEDRRHCPTWSPW